MVVQYLGHPRLNHVICVVRVALPITQQSSLTTNDSYSARLEQHPRVIYEEHSSPNYTLMNRTGEADWLQHLFVLLLGGTQGYGLYSKSIMLGIGGLISSGCDPI